MKALKNLMNSTVLVLSFSITGIVVVVLIFSYVFSVAGPVIEASIISLSYTIGYGLVALTVIAICCATAIMLSGSFEFVGNRIFGFQISRSRSKKELLQSQFEFRTLQQGEQGFMFSDLKNDSLVGRNISLEPGPFTSQSLPDRDPVALRMWAFLNAPAQPAPVTNDSVPMLEAQQGNSLNFEQIARKALSSRGAGRFIAFGAMESGKTTLAKHTLDYAVNEIAHNRGGDVYVIDPHAPETVWNDDVKVIGAGLDYQSIANFLLWLITDVKERYKMGCGDDSKPLPKPPMFIICEEWNGVIGELQAQKQWTDTHNRTLYMDARKAGVGYFLVSHEHTVKALGLQGMSNLLGGVEHFISLDKDAITEQYSATIGKSFKDKSPYELVTPGAYHGRLHYSHVQIESEKSKVHKYLVFDNPHQEPEPEPEPDRADVIRRLHSEGLTKQGIAQHFGYKSNSGRIYYEIKSALNGDA